MVDWFPTICGLAGLPVPRSCEGVDRSSVLLGAPNDNELGAFLMNFSKWFDWFQDGAEWRGVRTEQHMYVERLNGTVELYDLEADPWQTHNLAASDAVTLAQLKAQLAHHQHTRSDELVPCTDWKHWLDPQRRVIRNAFGPLSHPESEPDWSLLH